MSSTKSLLLFGPFFLTINLLQVESYHVYRLYRENAPLLIPCKALNELAAVNDSNCRNDTIAVQWFNGTLKVALDANTSTVLENGTLNLTVTKWNKGWYTCVVYSNVSSNVCVIEDVLIEMQVVDFDKLYQQNLIAAIIVSTSFVLLVLLAWLIWSYRWQPSEDDGDGKNDPENKKKSSKKPIFEHIVNKAKEFAKNRRRKGPAQGTPQSPMEQGGWMPNNQFAYHNQISSDSETESAVVTVDMVSDSPLARQPAIRRPSQQSRKTSNNNADPAPVNLHRSGKLVEDPNARISTVQSQQQRQENGESSVVVLKMTGDNSASQQTEQPSPPDLPEKSSDNNIQLSEIIVHPQQQYEATDVDADDEADVKNEVSGKEEVKQDSERPTSDIYLYF